MRRRVVVTGIGLVTPLSALGARETWRALLECRTGVRSLTEEDMTPEHRHALSQLPCRIAAPVSDAEFSQSPWAPQWWSEWQRSQASPTTTTTTATTSSSSAARSSSSSSSSSSSTTLPRFAGRASAFACAAAAEALADAGLDLHTVDPSRVAVSVGVGMPAVRAAALAGGELLSSSSSSFARRKADGEGGREGNNLSLLLLSPPTSRLLRDSALASGPASLLASSLGLKGPLFAPSTACAAGASAVADAFEAVASGKADFALAGGSEACVDAVTLAAFSRMRALCGDSNDAEKAPWASRPFGEGRSGFVVGEGAGVLVLEAAETAAKRGKKKKDGSFSSSAPRAYCELRGTGVSADAHHAAQPREGGPGAAAAMRRALRDSGLGPWDVSHVSAHATSTPAGDAAEASALSSVFSSSDSSSRGRRSGGEEIEGKGKARHLPPVVSGVKAAIGHLLGAAGAVEAALAVAALADARAPPTATLALEGGGEEEEGSDEGNKRSRVGVEERGFEIARAVAGGVPLSSPSSSSSSSSSSPPPLVALSNSFGFGGANVCLAFSSPPGAAGVGMRRWREEGEE